MDERTSLPLLLEDLVAQRWPSLTVYVCVNQPDAWWNDGDDAHAAVCRENVMLLQQLRQWTQRLELTVLDCASPSSGWPLRRQGVGWARKRLLDRIMSTAADDDIVVSLDADTRISEDYLCRVAATFDACPSWAAVAVPYFHRLSGDESADRALLRYECYMRHYLIQMLRIGNPYAFTAIGSSMAFTAQAYRRTGGVRPLQGGEDFYLMQKFVKTGQVGLWLVGDADAIPVFPSGRVSHRVPFGTGPAVSMDLAGQAARYPFFAPAGFAAVGETFARFVDLYDGDVATPMTDFLQRQLDTDDLWGPLRRNHTSRDRFVHACVERVDGLRILQYLRSRPDGILPDSAVVDFAHTPLSELNEFRNALMREEMSLRQQ